MADWPVPSGTPNTRRRSAPLSIKAKGVFSLRLWRAAHRLAVASLPSRRRLLHLRSSATLLPAIQYSIVDWLGVVIVIWIIATEPRKIWRLLRSGIDSQRASPHKN